MEMSTSTSRMHIPYPKCTWDYTKGSKRGVGWFRKVHGRTDVAPLLMTIGPAYDARRRRPVTRRRGPKEYKGRGSAAVRGGLVGFRFGWRGGPRCGERRGVAPLKISCVCGSASKEIPFHPHSLASRAAEQAAFCRPPSSRHRRRPWLARGIRSRVALPTVHIDIDHPQKQIMAPVARPSLVLLFLACCAAAVPNPKTSSSTCKTSTTSSTLLASSSTPKTTTTATTTTHTSTSTSSSLSSATVSVCTTSSSVSGAAPTVKVQHATVIGSSSAGVDTFNGVCLLNPALGQAQPNLFPDSFCTTSHWRSTPPYPTLNRSRPGHNHRHRHPDSMPPAVRGPANRHTPVGWR